jgi:hypothetical protein
LTSGNSSGWVPDARIVSHVDDLVVANPDPIELDVRLRVSGDHLEGELQLPSGQTIAFHGWLGLIGAVEAAVPADISGLGSGTVPDVSEDSAVDDARHADR